MMNSNNTSKKSRLSRVLNRLENQLKSNIKPLKEKINGRFRTFKYKNVPLEERDIKRINKEIEVLKSKI